MLPWLFSLAALSLEARPGDDPGYWQQHFPNLREPTADSRPKVRTRADRSNIEALAAAGFGSAEIGIDFRSDPRTARSALRDLLESAHRSGLHIDLAPGGPQPYVSPGIDEANSMQQLVGESVALTGPRDYAGAPSQPARLAGHATLVAITAARVIDDRARPVVLESRDAVDLTARLDATGTLHWKVPPGRWLLFTFWQRATGQVMGGNPFEPPSAWSARVPQSSAAANFTADIFSSKGILAALAYLDSSLLAGDEELLRGGDLAHDSLEVQAEMFWTADLPAEFHRRRGYSLIPYLPVLQIPKESSFDPLDPAWGGPLPAPSYDFAQDLGERVRYDYRQTLTDLYCDRYLRSLSAWAGGKGMRSRVQVAYNYVALDMLRSARAVDIAENETFDSGWVKAFDPSIPAYGTDRWRHAMDSYRLTGSGAHLAGRARATVEFGDDFAIYRKQPADYVQQLHEALAGGITMGLLTAFSSADTVWPVPQGLAHMGLGDDWTAAWPQWRDWRRLNDYFARSTQLLESGQARVDVTIYHDRGLATVHEDAPLFAGDGLERAGYTYDFIDPEALSSREASTVDGLLYGRGVGYRALILDHQSAMPDAAVQAILAMARRGLPVVILGAPPAKSTGFRQRKADDERVKAAMTALIALPNVAQIEDGGSIAQTLNRLQCLPAASFGDSGDLLSVRRQESTHDLWWIFNPTDRVISTEASLAAVGTPYLIDLWSGNVSRIAQWQGHDRRTLVPLQVMPHQTVAVAIRRDEAAPLHVISATAPVLQAGDDFVMIADTPGRIVFSSGVSDIIDPRVRPTSLSLSSWHLHVDELLPDGPRAHDLELTALTDLRQVSDLKDAVGSAVYTADVRLTSDWFGSDRDTLLEVGEVKGAMQLAVNGHLVTEQTMGNGQWLVGQWLKPGSNMITVRVDTTLLNRFAALRAAGDPRYQTGPTGLSSAPSGLLGPVTLKSAARLSAHGLH
jgi:alpha-L-rhamnosidase